MFTVMFQNLYKIVFIIKIRNHVKMQDYEPAKGKSLILLLITKNLNYFRAFHK